MNYFVYIIRTDNNKLYIGQTNSLGSWIKRHRNRKGAEFVRNCQSFKIVYHEKYPSRLEAMRREKQIKRWTRAKKEALIAGNLKLLKKL
jgi:predicted GIY-YIG superfamily endonuclease